MEGEESHALAEIPKSNSSHSVRTREKTITNTRLVIIAGVTGIIGSQFLDHYARQEETVVYGLSRKGLSVEAFLQEGKLPLATLRLQSEIDKPDFVDHIDWEHTRELLYIHALGHYPTEMNRKGERVVENDEDGDGIDDCCKHLCHDVFIKMVSLFRQREPLKQQSSIIFGSLADAHRSSVHQSFWRMMEETKRWSAAFAPAHPHTKIMCADISSVLTPDELLERPYVFTHTNADPACWLSPHQLAQFVAQKIQEAPEGFSEIRHFIPNGSFSYDHFKEENYIPRRMKELFGNC